MYRLQVCLSLLSQTERIHHVTKVFRNNPHLTGTPIFHSTLFAGSNVSRGEM
jgi:hypothetical protein